MTKQGKLFLGLSKIGAVIGNKNFVLVGCKKIVLYLFLFVTTFQITGQVLSEVNFSDSSFPIGEFNDQESILSMLKSQDKISNYGLSIKIEKDSINQNFALQLNSGNLSLESFFEKLNLFLNNNPTAIFPLFIDFDGAEPELISALKSAKLLDKIFFQPVGERWPTIEKILAQKKQLIIFNQGTKLLQSNNIINATDHIVDFSIDNNLNSNLKHLNYTGAFQNELLQIKKFTDDNLSKEDVPENWSRISLNSFAIDYLLESWNSVGKRPNFIFYSSTKYNVQFHYLCNTIRNYAAVSGKVSVEGKIVNEVQWKHQRQAVTNGYYSFSYDQATPLTLTPLKHGYRFTPESIQIEKSTDNSSNIDFLASPLSITDNLTAYYKLDKSIENLVNSSQIHQQTNSFVNDTERGVVLKLSGETFVPLKAVEEYKIVNSSFTISIYFKLINNQENSEYCLFGSNEDGFRKGLHAIIKSGQPLFGFFTNDCASNITIAPLKWYHLVVRYDIDSETQSIFIDGKKVGESSDHPSFIGSSELLLGHGIKQNNYLNGYLDDLLIWNRALSDTEIAWLNKNNMKLTQQSWIKQNLSRLFIAIAGFITILILLFWVRKSKRSKTETNQQTKSNDSVSNSIHLYGKFMVIDANGKDHSNEFSPKIKELFILLLLSSIKNFRGISTNKLTEIMWNGFSASKAANNRGVSFNHLKKIITDVDGISIVYENEYWRLILDEDMFCDYKFVFDFFKDKKDDYEKLFSVIKSGEFLQGATKEWFLDFQSTHNFDLIDVLLSYSKEQYKNKAYKSVIEITTYILTIDDLNIQALYYQLNSLVNQDSANKAVFLFDKFCLRYKAAQSKPFEYDLKQFLKEDVEALW